VIRIRSTSNTFNTLLPHPGKGVDGQIHCFRSNMSITSIDFHRLPRKSARNAWLAVPLLLCAAQAGWVMPLSCQATNLSMNQRFFFNHGGNYDSNLEVHHFQTRHDKKQSFTWDGLALPVSQGDRQWTGSSCFEFRNAKSILLTHPKPMFHSFTML
jgi:hypothetical protein